MTERRCLREKGLEAILSERSVTAYPLHNHVTVAALGLVVEGAVEVSAGQERRVWGENEVFLIPPYVPHSLRPRSPYTLLSLCVPAERISGSGWERTRADVGDFLEGVLGRPEAAARICQALDSPETRARMASRRRETALSGVMGQLAAHPERRYSLDDLAEAAYLSKYHLVRAFKQEVGLTPHQFQIQNRVRRAQRLLEAGCGIAEAALAAGFCDQSHFTRFFQRIVGLTPAEYRTAWNGSGTGSGTRRSD